jgi:hypothetical protein
MLDRAATAVPNTLLPSYNYISRPEFSIPSSPINGIITCKNNCYGFHLPDKAARRRMCANADDFLCDGAHKE